MPKALRWTEISLRSIAAGELYIGLKKMKRYLAFMTLVVLLASSCQKQDAKVNRSLQQPEPAPSSKTPVGAKELTKGLPLGSHTNSPASLLMKNHDGTLLIKIKPHVYMDELGCTMVMDGDGNTFSQLYHVIAFSIETKQYYTIWGVRFGKGPPINLDQEKEYRFLVKPYRQADFKDESVPCQIIKIWDGDRVLFEKQQKAQPTDTPDKK